MSDAMLQELVRWSKDHKPKEKGWSGSFFLSSGFIIACVCIILIIVVLFVWWRLSGKKEQPAPDVEQGLKSKAPPDKRSTTKYVTSDGKPVPKSQVVNR